MKIYHSKTLPIGLENSVHTLHHLLVLKFFENAQGSEVVQRAAKVAE